VKLNNLIHNISFINTTMVQDINVTDICIDSRKVKEGALFVAIKGTLSDGHVYISKAIAQGAKVIVHQELLEEKVNDIVYLQTDNSAKAAGDLAANFYGNPSKKLKVIGITGTNGKTSTVTLLHKVFSDLGYQVGLISTIKNLIGNELIPATHTTPDCITLQSLLNDMSSRGCEYCFMEVSSHAIDQYRIQGIDFIIAAFSNITHDHLDYHGDFKTYLYTKKRLFDGLSESAYALTNRDDKNGMVMTQNTNAKIKTYSLSSMADFRAQILENTFTGLVLTIDGREIHTKLVGEFNAYNLLAVYSIAMLLNADKEKVLTLLSALESVEGRFNYIISDKDKIVGIVDYAHTPDAVEKVLETINGSKTKAVKTITIIGCGGDRDKTKRPLMASVACKLSNKVILTSDNPRSENPVEIIKEMQTGITADEKKKVLSIVDRKEAIRTACTIADRGDIILLAGKGHEAYQEINGVKHPFDDKKILVEVFIELNR
jgi:UDP-N-acetylmuramoyl-L-alanyl-D-glutamate--2,6-diaminopimelate ligase